APDVDIRSVGGRPYRIVETSTGRLIGTTDAARAFGTVHPGAIYLHQGETFRVDDLKVDDHVALVHTEDADEFTQPRTLTDMTIIETEETSALGRCGLFRGIVEVNEHVVGYQRRQLPGGEIIERCELDLPPQHLITRAVWYTIP